MQLIRILRMDDQENNNIINGNGVLDRTQMYRELLSQVEDILESNDVGLQTVKRIKTILNEANLLNNECDIREKVSCPDEILLDSCVLSSASDLLIKCMRAIDVSSAKYAPLDFANRIEATIKSDETVQQLDFVKLLENARHIVPNVIETNFLYGTYDFSKLPEPKEKKQKVREAQEKIAKKELIEIKKTQTGEEETEDSVMFILKILLEEFEKNNRHPLKYYDFVVDNSSYAMTVENMFYCSFLIRDGKAKMEIDDAGVPIITPVHKKELKLFRSNNGVNTQMVISLDMDEWNSIKSRKGYIQKRRGR